jgi:glycosyltransferase involved in cell wall biosynthesis
MKLLYHLASTAVPGGSVRVLYNKCCWFVQKGGYEIVVVTTDQKGQPPYYDFPAQVKMIDLGIDYWDDYSKDPLTRTWLTVKKRNLHRKRLEKVLRQERPDVTLVHYPTEAWIAVRAHDDSRKVMEFHTSRLFRLQENPRGLHRWVACYRMWKDKRIAGKFRKLVVLTQEDARYWGKMPRLCVIPNAVRGPRLVADAGNSRTVIAVGRFIPLKGFDKLLEAWSKLSRELRAGWKLRLFGSGMLESSLQQRIQQLGIQDSVQLCPPTPEIYEEYAKSAFLVMTSLYEGLPMVMMEALSVGLPVVSFSFPCGPADWIENGQNGFIVPAGDVEELAHRMAELMGNDALRAEMSRRSLQKAGAFSEDAIMQKWEELFAEVKE